MEVSNSEPAKIEVKEVVMNCPEHGDYTKRVIIGMENIPTAGCPHCIKAGRLAVRAEVAEARRVEDFGKKLAVSDFEKRLGVIRKEAAHCEKHGEFIAVIGIRAEVEHRSGCPACAKEKQESDIAAQVAAEKRAAEIRRVERLLDQSAIPLRFQDKSFENYRAELDGQKRVLAAANRYVNEFPENLAKGNGLILTGGKGTGKTHIAVSIGREVISRHGCSFMFTTIAKIVRAVKETFDKDSELKESRIYADLASIDLLAIDEIGVQNGTDFERDVIFEIINRRYENMRPVILLSNLAPQDMELVIGERSMDRLREGGKALSFSWDSYRGGVRS